MKSKIKTAIAASTLMFSLMPNVSIAQETKTKNKTTLSIETDPVAFAFKGYSFHFRIKPKNSKHFLLGAGTYALSTNSRDKTWKVRIKSAYSLYSEYYFKEANKKWFVGLQAGVQNYKISTDNVSNITSEYRNFLIMPSVGFNWSPFKFPLYIKPWLGLGYTTKVAGTNTIDNKVYNFSHTQLHLAFHVGYTF